METICFKESVLQNANERSDDWGEIVTARIQFEHDLVAAKLNTTALVRSNISRKPLQVNLLEDMLINSFLKLCTYLNASDKCQYSVVEVLEMEGFLDGEEGYSVKWLKRKLKTHYGDDITWYGNISIILER